MGVRIGSGTITVRITDLEMPDEDDDETATREIERAVQSAIEGSCDTYRNALSVDRVDLDSWEAMDKWAEVRLTATVRVHVKYNPDEGVQPADWAYDQGWNYLAYEAQDVDFDHTILDDDAGEPSNEPEWDADDTVDNPADTANMLRRVAEDRRDQANRRARHLQEVVDRVVIHGDTHLDAYLDIDLAHDRANVEDHG